MTKDHEAIVHVINIALNHHEWRLVRHLTRLIEMIDADDAEHLAQPSLLMRQSGLGGTEP